MLSGAYRFYIICPRWRSYISRLAWEPLGVQAGGGGRSGLLCSGCCPRVLGPVPDKWNKTDGWMICAVQEERCCGKCANKMTSSYRTTRSNEELEYFIFPFTWFVFTSCIMCYEVQDVCALMTDCVSFVHLIKTE